MLVSLWYLLYPKGYVCAERGLVKLRKEKEELAHEKDGCAVYHDLSSYFGRSCGGLRRYLASRRHRCSHAGDRLLLAEFCLFRSGSLYFWAWNHLEFHERFGPGWLAFWIRRQQRGELQLFLEWKLDRCTWSHGGLERQRLFRLYRYHDVCVHNSGHGGGRIPELCPGRHYTNNHRGI